MKWLTKVAPIFRVMIWVGLIVTSLYMMIPSVVVFSTALAEAHNQNSVLSTLVTCWVIIAFVLSVSLILLLNQKLVRFLPLFMIQLFLIPVVLIGFFELGNIYLLTCTVIVCLDLLIKRVFSDEAPEEDRGSLT